MYVNTLRFFFLFKSISFTYYFFLKKKNLINKYDTMADI